MTAANLDVLVGGSSLVKLGTTKATVLLKPTVSAPPYLQEILNQFLCISRHSSLERQAEI